MIDSFFDVLLFPLFLASLALMTFLGLIFEIFVGVRELFMLIENKCEKS